MAKRIKIRLKISAIDESLKQVQANYDEINAKLSTHREALTDTIRLNMLTAYEYLNQILDEDREIFNDKGLQFILELNNIVLCGKDLEKRYEYAQFLGESQKRFYNHIEVIQKWYRKHDDSSTLKRAAEVYVGIISSPQLFTEGNHRTGSLVTSWILLRGGLPPFVLNLTNAVAFFEPSSHIKFTNKREIGGKLKLPKYQKAFKKFLEKFIDPTYVSYENIA